MIKKSAIIAAVIATGLLWFYFYRIHEERYIDRFKMKHAKVGDINIAYKEIGKGHPIVLICGYRATLDTWDPVVLKKLASRYRVIIFDNRGAGLTSASDKEFSIELFADDTAGLLNAIGIKDAHVLGYSMGGMIAQELALRYPDKVDKLILCATHCGGKEAVMPAPDVVGQLTSTSGTAEDEYERRIKVLFPKKWLLKNPDYRKQLPIVKEIVDVPIVKRQTKALENWKGSYGRLPFITQKTLVITGTDDVLIAPHNSFIIVGRIPGSWLIRIDGGGHGVIYQESKTFTRVILAFLKA